MPLVQPTSPTVPLATINSYCTLGDVASRTGDRYTESGPGEDLTSIEQIVADGYAECNRRIGALFDMTVPVYQSQSPRTFRELRDLNRMYVIKELNQGRGNFENYYGLTTAYEQRWKLIEEGKVDLDIITSTYDSPSLIRYRKSEAVKTFNDPIFVRY